MARNLDIALLRTFVSVADHASMTAAGNALHLTQSAVSQQVARLEALGGRLFVRERRALRLTPVGERLIGRARRLVALNDDVWAELADRAPLGRVRLGAPYDLVATCLVPMLKRFAERHPQAELALVSATSPQLLLAVQRGELDLALVEEPAGLSRGECLAVHRLVWVGARAGAAFRRSPLPLSLVADTCVFRPAILASLAGTGLAWRTVFENGSIDATAATVRSDLAVTACLDCAVPADLEVLPPSTALPALPPFAINLHPARSAASPVAAELSRLLRSGFGRDRQAA